MVGRARAVFKFGRRLPNLDSIFRTNWQIMVEDEQRLQGAFPEPPMICFRRGKNVQETLCQVITGQGKKAGGWV